ncbi:hypothetical protein PHISP_06069 [Aspergillus sp. HF37]|nr:hypothetical protein PHISP_06069 [Aspergillus sp. HF37]
MFRSAVVRSLRSSMPRVPRTPASFQLRSSPVARPSQFAPAASFQAVRFYSAPAGLQKDEVVGRVVNLLKNFDKVSDPSKINPTSHFTNDLGLDSLDTVEVVMAIEEVCLAEWATGRLLTLSQEFSVEIPDKEADGILSIDKAVDYILAQPDAH